MAGTIEYVNCYDIVEMFVTMLRCPMSVSPTADHTKSADVIHTV